jgi:hypothetical protein
MPEVQHHDPLMQPIFLDGKEYRTSHYLHRYYQTNSPNGGKYQQHGHFIRVLKGLETYQMYLETGDLIVLPSYAKAMAIFPDFGKTNENKSLRDAFQAINNHTMYLVNDTIQVALAHHLDDEVSKQLSVAANTATARQLTGKGSLPTEQAQRTLQAMLKIGQLMGTPPHIAIEVGVKQALLDTGVDLQPLLVEAPVMDDIAEEDVMLEPTDLAARLQVGTGQAGAIAINKLLGQIGWQARPRTGVDWELTAAGKPYASTHAWMRHGKTGYNFKWNVAAVRQELTRRHLLRETAA